MKSTHHNNNIIGFLSPILVLIISLLILPSTSTHNSPTTFHDPVLTPIPTEIPIDKNCFYDNLTQKWCHPETVQSSTPFDPARISYSSLLIPNVNTTRQFSRLSIRLGVAPPINDDHLQEFGFIFNNMDIYGTDVDVDAPTTVLVTNVVDSSVGFTADIDTLGQQKGYSGLIF